MCENYRRNPVFRCFLTASHYNNDSTLKSTGDIEHLLCASSRLSIYQVIYNLRYVHLCLLQTTVHVTVIITLNLQMREVRHRMIKRHSVSHIIRKWHIRMQTPPVGSHHPKPTQTRGVHQRSARCWQALCTQRGEVRNDTSSLLHTGDVWVSLQSWGSVSMETA